jgi:RNA polymerase sigma factor (sigma-70 family)
VDWATICTRLRSDSNDQGAWDALEARVRGLASARLRGLATEIVEDAIADTCASVVMDLSSARSPDTFKGFVLGKYLNVAKGAFRLAEIERVAIDRAYELAAIPSESSADPRFAVLDACLEGLPERDRRAVELRYFAKARAEQIARELRVSEGNARRIVFNGVNRLRKCAQAAVGPLTSSSRGSGA